MPKFKYILIGVVGFGFLIRVAFLLNNPNFNYTRLKGTAIPFEVSYFKKAMSFDSQEYKALALNIVNHHRFSWDSEPATFRTPGYPLFIAGIYSLFGVKDWVVMLFQAFLSVATIYLVYLIARSSFGELAGIISACLFSIDFTSILFSSLFMSETLYVFFLLLGVWLFLKQNTSWCVHTSALVFGLSSLIRPIGVYLFIPLLLFLWFKVKKGSYRLQFMQVVIFLVLFFLPILPWVVRNYKIYHSPTLSSLGGFNLLLSNAALLESEESGVSIDSAQAEFSKKLLEVAPPDSDNPLLLASLAQKIGFSRIMRSPLRYAYIHLKGDMKMLVSTKSDDILLKISGADEVQPQIIQSELLTSVYESQFIGSKIILLLFAGLEVIIVVGSIIFALISFIRSRSDLSLRYPNLLFFALACYFLVFSGGPFGDSRYRLPLIPYVYILASCLISRAVWKRK
jgi:4-amino-4-deoxy-L-arabinose transferase-like glycosyltransferase